jgi:hypothetical protein
MHSKGELEAERLDRLERERIRQSCRSTRLRLAQGSATGSATSPRAQRDETPAAEAQALLLLVAERLDRLDSHVLALEQGQRARGRSRSGLWGRLTAAVLLVAVSAASTLALLGWMHRSTPAATEPAWSDAPHDENA